MPNQYYKAPQVKNKNQINYVRAVVSSPVPLFWMFASATLILSIGGLVSGLTGMHGVFTLFAAALASAGAAYQFYCEV